MDLSTSYLGLKLKNPLVPGAGPLTAKLESIKQLEDAGAAAIVLSSLFEEQISHEADELEYFLESGAESFAEALSYFPHADSFHSGPDEYLAYIANVKRSVDIPVIASLNGKTIGGWTEYARSIQEAGADAIELNVYFLAANTKLTGRAVEGLHEDILKAVKNVVSIPVALKISPFFSGLSATAAQLDAAGADALVLFNRFYQPDIDLDALEVVPKIKLSTSSDLLLPLRWIAILHGRLECGLAASSGIWSGEDALKALMAGADAVQLCSVLLNRGPSGLTTILGDMRAWMEKKEYESVEQLKGSMSQKSCPEPAAFERANYMAALHSFD